MSNLPFAIFRFIDNVFSANRARMDIQSDPIRSPDGRCTLDGAHSYLRKIEELASQIEYYSEDARAVDLAGEIAKTIGALEAELRDVEAQLREMESLIEAGQDQVKQLSDLIGEIARDAAAVPEYRQEIIEEASHDSVEGLLLARDQQEWVPTALQYLSHRPELTHALLISRYRPRQAIVTDDQWKDVIDALMMRSPFVVYNHYVRPCLDSPEKCKLPPERWRELFDRLVDPYPFPASQMLKSETARSIIAATTEDERRVIRAMFRSLDIRLANQTMADFALYPGPWLEPQDWTSLFRHYAHTLVNFGRKSDMIAFLDTWPIPSGVELTPQEVNNLLALPTLDRDTRLRFVTTLVPLVKSEVPVVEGAAVQPGVART